MESALTNYSITNASANRVELEKVAKLTSTIVALISRIDNRQRNPCENGGNCMDLINVYLCTCEPGFTGKRCQHTIDFCSSKPCQNGATCTDAFNCKCRPGYVGLQCEAAIDECLSDPCNPVGTDKCVDLDNKYFCMCRKG